jgi:hypothetical protein
VTRGGLPSRAARLSAGSGPTRGARALRTCGEVSPQRAAPLAWAAQLETLEEVLRRGLSIADVVVQDEYTHDVVASAGELYLVFDST